VLPPSAAPLAFRPPSSSLLGSRGKPLLAFFLGKSNAAKILAWICGRLLSCVSWPVRFSGCCSALGPVDWVRRTPVELWLCLSCQHRLLCSLSPSGTRRTAVELFLGVQSVSGTRRCFPSYSAALRLTCLYWNSWWSSGGAVMCTCLRLLCKLSYLVMESCGTWFQLRFGTCLACFILETECSLPLLSWVFARPNKHPALPNAHNKNVIKAFFNRSDLSTVF
jgi:hypothetical protein